MVSTSWHQLAEALIVALEPALPDGFRAKLETDDGGIAFFQPDVPHARVVAGVQPLLEQPGDERELVARVCLSVLDTAPDFVAEFTGEPWPGSAKDVPLPGVEVRDAEVSLWYGQRDSPTLVLEPIHR